MSTAPKDVDHAFAVREALERYNQYEAEFVDTEPIILQHVDALAARVERLQRLWQAWQRAQGMAPRSEPYGAFLDVLKACEDHGDLLPVEDGR